jgi:hypothetical protein
MEYVFTHQKNAVVPSDEMKAAVHQSSLAINNYMY